jgi:hypothetical protein
VLRVQRFLPAVLLVACSAASFASSKLTLVFPDASEKLIFESSAWPTKEPANDTKRTSQKADYTIESSTKTDKVYVIDPTTNKVASKAIGDIKDGTWTLTAADFNALYKVKVEVSTPKGPVAAANVELEAGADKRNELVDPSANGIATFYFLKSGDVKVAVNYKAGGKAQSPVKQVFTIGGENSTLKVALPDGEAVTPALGATANAGNDSAKTSKDKDTRNDEPVKDPGSPLGGLITTVIGLAIVGGIGYFIISYMKKNPDQVKQTLTKLGADIPKPGDANNHVHDPIPVAPIAPQPMQQIILDGGAPSPVPISSAPIQQIQISTPAASTGIPRMVASDGSAFDLPEGPTVVGREFGAGLVVPNDTISRKHASVTKNGSQVEVEDHASTNGTWINGGKLNGSQILRPGDSVRFGSVEFRYEA